MFGKFLLPFLIVALLSYIISAIFFFTIPPRVNGDYVYPNIFYFLIFTSLAFGLTLSFIFYFLTSIASKLARQETQVNHRKIFLRSLRRGFSIILVLTCALVLKIFGIFNVLNISLLIGIAVLIEIYFSGK